MKLLAVALLGATLAVSGFGYQESQTDAEAQLRPLPPLTLQDFNGKAVPADGLKGSVIVLDFWATWCAPCITEIPVLNKLQEKYGKRGLKVVGVTLASGEPKEVKPFVTNNGMKYTVLMGDDDQAYDFNIMGFPTTFLVTRDLKVYRKYVGAGPRKSADLEADIEKLLGEGNSKTE
jgi:thiol-disulfide isomerase/thioredoxin